ncbi:MAG: hypothetical protein AAB267_01755, partial [Candidatus Desantisbacteria bacterium]
MDGKKVQVVHDEFHTQKGIRYISALRGISDKKIDDNVAKSAGQMLEFFDKYCEVFKLFGFAASILRNELGMSNAEVNKFLEGIDFKDIVEAIKGNDNLKYSQAIEIFKNELFQKLRKHDAKLAKADIEAMLAMYEQANVVYYDEVGLLEKFAKDKFDITGYKKMAELKNAKEHRGEAENGEHNYQNLLADFRDYVRKQYSNATR